MLAGIRSGGELAGAMRNLLGHPGEAARLRAAGLERVRRVFQVDGITQKHLDVYARLAAHPPNDSTGREP